MIARSILDTDILSEYLKGHDPAVAGQAARYAAEHGVFMFTSVTVYEIAFGLELKGAYAQLQRAMAWMNQNEAITPAAGDYLAAATIRVGSRHHSRQGSETGLGSGSARLPDCRCRGLVRPAAGHWQHRRFPSDPENRRRPEAGQLAGPESALGSEGWAPNALRRGRSGRRGTDDRTLSSGGRSSEAATDHKRRWSVPPTGQEACPTPLP